MFCCLCLDGESVDNVVIATEPKLKENCMADKTKNKEKQQASVPVCPYLLDEPFLTVPIDTFTEIHCSKDVVHYPNKLYY